MSTAGNLRAELFGATTKTPPFALLLPHGWRQQSADIGALRVQAKEAVGQAAGIDATSVGRGIDALFSQLEDTNAQDRERMIAWVSPTDVPVDSFVPMSMALAWLEAPPGVEMTSMAKQLVTQRGAKPLDDRGTILRWLARVDHTVDDGTVHTVQPTYLIRVPHDPGTALIIRTTILDGGNGEHVDHDDLQAMTLLSDGIISTFRWRKDA